MPTEIKNRVLTYEGSNYMRYRLLLSTLSGKPVRIINIRRKENDPGLREYEVSFIRMLDKITNGTKIEINESGTSIYYIPGLLYGGELEHDCSLQRGIGYYLEGVMILAPFCKKPIDLKLRGITNNSTDPSVDRILTAGVPILKKFLAGDNEVVLKICKRGAAPLGGGEVCFKCPISRNLKTIQLEDSGMVKRVRGTACSIRVSPAVANRIVESAKGILLKFLPDIYIHTDHCKGSASGKSPGFGVTLTAETTKEVFFSGQAFSPLMTTGSLPCVPEDIGKEAAMKLLDEIYRNGCVDSVFQSMTAVFMALGKKDVSKVIVGPLTPAMIQFLRDLRDFFGTVFKIEPVKEEEELLPQVHLTCLGIGYTNISKRTL
ncbi:RNA 3'-terminal phosphate cyclase-like protein [Harpegnathos saltator]|uniref:Probable RNA 3'-terminal phosphate cyclase-like protein n=1 Tax=Harpegnathos saltator TaxID=610380 RepID=E2B4Q9_HARSA|nr:RNA 3'-terminal phosphate cyclase-like protein [Harpegnathos saltator]EFN89340.1 Probable RNA 3'-terminal phosphate cyclase-like protein [Harpegnathos saltator]